MPLEMVTTAPRMAALFKELSRHGRIALDTESNGFHRYPERVCLVQLATPSGVHLIDPLVVDDMGALGEMLANEAIQKVLHAADYDIRSLDRQWGFRIRGLYDTSIAARFSGLNRLGLATVIQDVLGVVTSKDKRQQRSDWSLRPLSDRALEYAADDVRYLFDLQEVLAKRLETLGRTEWVAEECARLAEIRYSAPQVETAFLSAKGGGVLDGRGLAILKALFAFREAEARRRGRPPFRILPDSTLLFLAANPAADLAEVSGLGRGALQRIGKGLGLALRDGMRAPPVRRPKRPRETSAPREAAVLKELKACRTEEGTRLGLDPALLWPAPSLERLARTSGTLEAELNAPEVRAWQRRHLGPSLRACLARMNR